MVTLEKYICPYLIISKLEIRDYFTDDKDKPKSTKVRKWKSLSTFQHFLIFDENVLSKCSISSPVLLTQPSWKSKELKLPITFPQLTSGTMV